MKFNIDDYKGKYVMHCKTEEEAREFCNYLHSLGQKWRNGDSYLSNTHWEIFRRSTCYEFNSNDYGKKDFFEKYKYTILEWEDFTKWQEFTKCDLKTGDIVIFRDHQAGVVFLEQNIVVFKGFNGCMKLSGYNTKLYHYYTKEWDIVKVHRPSHYYELMHDQWYKAPIVWERKENEVEEMTLEEVCKALGKDIKIVKSK